SFPIDLEKLWIHAVASQPKSNTLKPYQVLNIIEREFNSKELVTAEGHHIEEIREFFVSKKKDGIVDLLVALREKIGLDPDLQNPLESLDDISVKETDPRIQELESFVDQTMAVSREIVEFFF